MITRIFRVRIKPELRAEFESDFETLSLPLVKAQPGVREVSIGKPVTAAPDDYVMISTWENEEALRRFVGETWTVAKIPPAMRRYVLETWVDHFTTWNKSRP